MERKISHEIDRATRRLDVAGSMAFRRVRAAVYGCVNVVEGICKDFEQGRIDEAPALAGIEEQIRIVDSIESGGAVDAELHLSKLKRNIGWNVNR
jgi:hypothetical protein